MSVKNKIPARCWYYLLDFNDQDEFETLISTFNVKGLHQLSETEFWQLFKIATDKDNVLVVIKKEENMQVNRYAHGCIFEDADTLLNSRNGKYYGYVLGGPNSMLLTHYVIKGGHNFRHMQEVKEGIDYKVTVVPTEENKWHGECEQID